MSDLNGVLRRLSGRKAEIHAILENDQAMMAEVAELEDARTSVEAVVGQNHQQLRDELKDIDEAISRINDGTYGVCIACGRPINHGRLDIWPHAKRCTDCQASHEQQGRSRRAPFLLVND